MKSQFFIVLALALCFIFSLTEGQSISQVFVTTTAAETRFTNATGGGTTVKYCGGSGQPVCINNNPPSRQCRWGTPFSSSSALKSGLGFEGVSNLVYLNQEFYIGQLSHFNYQIETGTAATSAILNIRVIVQDANTNITLGSSDFAYMFKVNETVNTPPCAFPPQSNPCSDEITFANSGFTTGSFQIGQVTYTVQLTGFKESQSSTSYSNPGFISQEDTQSIGYLFARITVACPNVCVGGGQYIITQDNRCICDCSTLPACPGSQVFSDNCTCQCPNPNLCLNGGVLNQTSCTCNCNACPFPKVLNPTNCDCPCNSTYCGNGLISNQTTCACSCPNTVCGPNFSISPTCGCVCNLNCSAQTPPKIRVNDTNICNCICANSTCSPGYQIDNSNCQCKCIRTCPNGQPLNATTCTCGACVGNWVQDQNGLCTKCGLNQTDCGGSAVLNTQSCSCNCNNATLCDPMKGEVIDTSQFCACRQCGTQPGDVCMCGNGIVEPGEDCDYVLNGTINPCCVNCKFTVNSCNDLNLCTDNDRCNGNGTCIGQYKCQPTDDCRTITCQPSVGVCDIVPKANGTACGDKNMCERRCVSGVCTDDPATFGSCQGSQYPDDPVDCFGWQCVPASGNCIQVALNQTTCSDGDACTISDTCFEGVCVGEQLECPLSNKQCKINVCVDGICNLIDLSDAPCNADNNACSPDDRCYGGVCIRGNTRVCQTSNPCLIASCNGATGECNMRYRNNIPCDDLNLCTTNDTCLNGTCSGVPDPTTVDLVECGASQSSGNNVGQTSLIIFTVAGAAAIISALVGGAFLIKKIRDSRLLDPDTWNPDTFNSVEINPTYKGLEKAFVNPLHDAQ